MKTQILDRNGLLKPIGMFLILMGMYLMILLLYIVFCSEDLSAQSCGLEKQSIAYNLTIKEVTIVHAGYKMPERIVSTIKPKVDIDELSSQLMIRNTADFRPVNMYAQIVVRKMKTKSRRKNKAKVVNTYKENAIGSDKVPVKLE